MADAFAYWCKKAVRTQSCANILSWFRICIARPNSLPRGRVPACGWPWWRCTWHYCGSPTSTGRCRKIFRPSWYRFFAITRPPVKGILPAARFPLFSVASASAGLVALQRSWPCRCRRYSPAHRLKLHSRSLSSAARANRPGRSRCPNRKPRSACARSP